MTVQAKIFWACLVLVGLITLSRFHMVTVEPGQVGVITDQPIIFGKNFGFHEGTRDEVQQPGTAWYWSSTKVENYSLAPIRMDEPLDHLPTADNNFINYESYLMIKITDPAYNVKHFGYRDWYSTNIQKPYRTIVRDVSKKYKMTAIMTDPATLEKIQNEVFDLTTALIKKTGLKLEVEQVSMGRSLPNKSVIAEMDNTAVQQQRKKTEDERKLSEDARFEAERSRAKADNVYRESMHLDPQEFVKLEEIKQYSEACKLSRNCVIVQGGSAGVMVGK